MSKKKQAKLKVRQNKKTHKTTIIVKLGDTDITFWKGPIIPPHKVAIETACQELVDKINADFIPTSSMPVKPKVRYKTRTECTNSVVQAVATENKCENFRRLYSGVTETGNCPICDAYKMKELADTLEREMGSSTFEECHLEAPEVTVEEWLNSWRELLSLYSRFYKWDVDDYLGSVRFKSILSDGPDKQTKFIVQYSFVADKYKLLINDKFILWAGKDSYEVLSAIGYIEERVLSPDQHDENVMVENIISRMGKAGIL